MPEVQQHEGLQVRKSSLQDELMSTAHVEEAAGIAKWLTQREALGPGDMENAWHRLEVRYGLPWRLFWSLRYRKPRAIASHVYHHLQAVYQAERDRQMKLLRHDIEITKQIAGADSAAVRAAEALVRENE